MKNKMMRNYIKNLISIIIVNWNRSDDLKITLTHLENLNPKEYEIIIIDNGSTDQSHELYNSLNSNIKIIQLPYNMGCETGFNIGILNAKGEIDIYLDSDAHIDIENLNKIREIFKSNSDVAIIEPRVIGTQDGKIQNEPKFWPIKNTFIGCAVAVHAKAYEKVGLRPDEYFLYSSELDFSMRLVIKNQKIIHRNDIIAYHRESPVERKSKSFLYYYTRNNIWSIFKYYPIKPLCYEILFHFCYCLFISIKNMQILSMIFGWISGFYQLPKMALKKRSPDKKVLEARLYPDIPSLINIYKMKRVKT